MNRTIEDIQKDIELLEIKGGYDIEQLLTPQDCRRLSYEIERLNNIINEAKIYCEDVIQEHENGEYDVDTVWLAIKEHKGNINSILNILNGDTENYWRSDKE